MAAPDHEAGGDGHEFDVYLKGAKRPHLSWARVKEHRDKMHPRIVTTSAEGKAQYRRVNCCDLNVGCHK